MGYREKKRLSCVLACSRRPQGGLGMDSVLEKILDLSRASKHYVCQRVERGSS